MLKTIFNQLEDPEKPLLGPNIKGLKFFRLLLPDSNKTFWCLIHCILPLFVVLEYVDIFTIMNDLENVLHTLKYALVAAVNVSKVIDVITHQKEYKEIFDFVTKADKLSRDNANEEDKTIIEKYTRYCRKFTYSYWVLLSVTLVGANVQPVIRYLTSSNQNKNNLHIVRVWVPFDGSNGLGYVISIIFECHAMCYASGLMAFYDSVIIVVMEFFKNHLLLLKLECSRIYDGDSDEAVLASLKNCQQRHADLMKYAAMFNARLSPIMFFCFVVTSATICANISQIMSESDKVQALLMLPYATVIVMQLFVYCWHGNQILYMSHEPMRGLYQSAWSERPIYRKEFVILCSQLDRRVIFTAGPFARLTVEAFINIMKGAYSYYTLTK